MCINDFICLEITSQDIQHQLNTIGYLRDNGGTLSIGTEFFSDNVAIGSNISLKAIFKAYDENTVTEEKPIVVIYNGAVIDDIKVNTIQRQTYLTYRVSYSSKVFTRED